MVMCPKYLLHFQTSLQARAELLCDINICGSYGKMLRVFSCERPNLVSMLELDVRRR